MGTPHFYYWPDPSGSVERVDLGEELSDLQEEDSAEVVDAYGGDGMPYRHWLGSSLKVRIVLERFGAPGTSGLERKIKTMVSHLQRGGFCIFSRDSDRTWATAALFPPARGDTSIPVGANGLAGIEPSAALVAGDELVIESPWPEGQRDYQAVSSTGPWIAAPISGGGIDYTYAGTPLLRWRDCYPALRLPADQIRRQIVPHDHRRNWTLDLILEYPLALALSLWTTQEEEAQAQQGGSQAITSSPQLRGDAGGVGSSLEQLLRPSVQRHGQAGYRNTDPLYRR